MEAYISHESLYDKFDISYCLWLSYSHLGQIEAFGWGTEDLFSFVVSNPENTDRIELDELKVLKYGHFYTGIVVVEKTFKQNKLILATKRETETVAQL